MSAPEFLPLNGAVPRQPLTLRRPTGAEVAPLPGAEGDAGVPLTRAPRPESEAEAARDAARQFEALFLSYLYKTMRATVPESPFGEGQSGAMFEDMFTPAVGNDMAEAGGIGLADLMVRHFGAGTTRVAAAALRNASAEEARAAGISSTPGAPIPESRTRIGQGARSGGIDPREVKPLLQAAPADRTAVEWPQLGGKKLPDLADNVRQALDRAATQTGVDRDLLTAVVVVESGGNPNAESPRGARGLMQLMAGTARELGVQDAFDPLENVMAGARYLKRMLVTHGGDERLALAAYNAGPGNVRRHGGVPPFRETRNYIERVLDLRRQLGGPAT